MQIFKYVPVIKIISNSATDKAIITSQVTTATQTIPNYRVRTMLTAVNLKTYWLCLNEFASILPDLAILSEMQIMPSKPIAKLH
jgi:hypothetical protein